MYTYINIYGQNERERERARKRERERERERERVREREKGHVTRNKSFRLLFQLHIYNNVIVTVIK